MKYKMKFKNILVHVENSTNSKTVIEAACKLAIRNEATLTGFFVLESPSVYVASEAGLASVVIESQQQQNERDEKDAFELFHQITSGIGHQSHCQSNWVTERGITEFCIARQAYYADLVVVGQTNSHDSLPVAGTTKSSILTHAGKPILFIPYIGLKNDEIGNNILIAWKETKESARAVCDALPVLKAATSVWAISVSKVNSEHNATDSLGFYLKQHGIDAELHSIFNNGDLSTSDIILNQLSDNGSDLLVMGGYGHSRLREFILGGVTQAILKHMTVPVLISH